MREKKFVLLIVLGITCTIIPIAILLNLAPPENENEIGVILINHDNAHLDDFKLIPEEWILKAKSDLNVVYWHTSHGNQIIVGMDSLDGFMGDTGLYTYNSDGSGGALKIDDIYGNDLSNNLNDFDDITRSYLNNPANLDVNVVMWSWCTLNTDFNKIDQYLWSMTQLEKEYSNVSFIYMTGHLDGSGESGAVHLANQRIRAHCEAHKTILYDFADIESYNPDDEYFLDRGANDGCYYDGGGNWATEWQDLHVLGTDWYDCNPDHTEAINGNMKAYGTWYLFARLAGWGGL